MIKKLTIIFAVIFFLGLTYVTLYINGRELTPSDHRALQEATQESIVTGSSSPSSPSTDVVKNKVSKSIALAAKVQSSTSSKMVIKSKNEPLLSCSNFALAKLQQDETSYKPVVIPGLDARIRSLSHQRIGFDSVKPSCFIEDTPDSPELGASTLYDGLSGQTIASFVLDYNKAYESNTAPDSSCVILNKKNCSNQDFVDFVHEKIRGDISQSTQWFKYSSPEYAFQIYFPAQPNQLVSRKEKESGVLSFESWAGVDNDRVMYSALAWQHDTSVSPVLNMEPILEQGLKKFVEGVVSTNPDAKLLSSRQVSFLGSQARDFKIQNGTNTISGRLFAVADKSYFLTYECPGTCDTVNSMIFLDSFRPK